MPLYSAPFELAAGADFSVPELTILKAEKVLQGVSVSSKKPMVEVRADKTVMNIEGNDQCYRQ
ncbi:MAG: hypothetical protein WDO16_20110 [Bacteroidota bacterium]